MPRACENLHAPIENNEQTTLASKDEELYLHGKAGNKLGNVTCGNTCLSIYGKF
jgi:hypothetical protein